MSTFELILGILVKYGPDAARAVVKLLGKKDITLEEWEAVFIIAEKSYAEYVKPK